MTYSILLVLIIIVSILLVLIIMVQNPKGGGLSSSLTGAGQSLGGVQQTSNFLDQSTKTLAIIFFGLIMISNLISSRVNNLGQSSQIENAVEPTTLDSPDSEIAPNQELDTTK